ncbi:MAG: iron export ABC transporter permease subunit FetB [Planctomycetota bacterium]
MIAVIHLSGWQLLAAAALILVNAAISLALSLGLGQRLLLASLRSVVQLTILGGVLVWVFSREGPWAVIVMMCVMGIVAGYEAVRRTSHRIRGGYLASQGVMLFTSLLVTLYGVVGVIGVRPWYTPQYVIPILGMILGNTLNGISLGLETVLEGFATRREQVELLLAHGATRREASRDVVRRAVRTGMIPILNSMVAAGLVSIPGMMTGQILAGQDPAAAARYQIFILFSIAGGVALGTMGIVLAATRLAFDEHERLRTDRIRTVRR